MADQFKQYAVVAFPDMETLVKEVNGLLARGWTPLGGLVLKQVASETIYFQSMAKFLYQDSRLHHTIWHTILQ